MSPDENPQLVERVSIAEIGRQLFGAFRGKQINLPPDNQLVEVLRKARVRVHETTEGRIRHTCSRLNEAQIERVKKVLLTPKIPKQAITKWHTVTRIIRLLREQPGEPVTTNREIIRGLLIHMGRPRKEVSVPNKPQKALQFRPLDKQGMSSLKALALKAARGETFDDLGTPFDLAAARKLTSKRHPNVLKLGTRE
jgi:hypothetical protein